MVANPNQLPRNRPKPDQEKLVESCLDEHLHSTVVQNREGIAAETGFRIKQV